MEKQRNISKRIKLYDRASEIYEKLPKDFATHILNSIIVRSLSNGVFVQEASMYLSTDQLDLLFKDLNISTQKKEIRKKAVVKREVVKKEAKEKISPLFEGFS